MSVRVAALSLLAAAALIFPAAGQPGDVAPRPLTATTLMEGDYPLLALVEGAQGRTVVNVSVAPDGRVVDASVGMSSGSAALDQAAVQIARTRWRFQPGTRNGQPIAAIAPVDLNWVLPLQPVTHVLVQAPALPNGAEPPRAAARIVARPGDYPSISMEAKEQGVVGVRYLVRTDGSVGDVQLAQSSGFARLDNAALRVVRERARANPARAGGNPVEAWQTVAVSFSLLPVNSYGARPACYAQPIIARESILIGAEREFLIISELDLERLMRWRVRPVEGWVPIWTQVSDTGAVTEAIIETRNGWMRLNGPWTQALTRDRRYPQANRTCWYYDPVAILG
jgi:TonB family protein